MFACPTAIPPSFPIPLQRNQPAARGGSVLIVCDPMGAPKPTIRWYRQGSQITSGGRFNVTEDGNLLINDVEDGDGGEYRCEATNTFSTESSTGSLVIKGLPYFMPFIGFSKKSCYFI